MPVPILTLGVFGINNDSVNTAVNVLILVLLVVWVALIFWTFSDARRRIDDPLLVGCATVASLWSQLSGPPAEIEGQPHAAVRLAQELAGEDGAVVATGSIYLVADLLAAPGTRRRSAL